MKKITIEEIKELAKKQWEGCHGCDENDKYFFINGFITGYLSGQVNEIDNQIKSAQDKIASIIIENK